MVSKKRRRGDNQQPRHQIINVDVEQIASGWANAALGDMLTDNARRRGVTIRDDAIAYLDKDSGVYVVAVGLEDPDAVNLQVGIWAVGDLLKAETIASVNQVACDLTTYRKLSDSPRKMMKRLTAAQVVLVAYETRLRLRGTLPADP